MDQLTLTNAFAESEAADSQRRAEQRAYLVGALARVRASSDLRIFVGAVYHHTAASSSGCWWNVRIRELCGAAVAAGSQVDPLRDLLGCSERQAKRVAGQARQLGLVRTRPAGRDQGEDGRQPGESWEYQIDWLGVRRLIGLEAVEVGRGQAGPGRGQAGPGRGQAGPGRGQAGPGRGQAGPGRGQAGPAADAPLRNTRAPAGPVPDPDRVFERKQTRTGSGTGALGPRLLDGLTLGTLTDTAELMRLFEQVSACSPIAGLDASCEADRLFVATAAECALRCGKNPVAYFRSLVQGVRRDVPTMADEDAAVPKLRAIEEGALCPT
jgi:hypothetical protein